MNDDKMIRALAWVEDEREAFAQYEPNAVGFNMNNWFNYSTRWFEGIAYCGTTACLAGHACLMEGYEMTGYQMVKSDNGTLHFAEDKGAEILGLNSDEQFIFYLNTLDQVYANVARLMGVDEVVLRDKVEAGRRGR